MPHLLVAISSHGLGHLSQVAPVINRLRELLPDLKLTLRTRIPREKLALRIGGAFSLQPIADDFGMVQHNALEVDVEASLRRYRLQHRDWSEGVARVAEVLRDAGPDLIFADIPYLTLAAAQRAAIPAVAMCSLNWEAILRGYHGDEGDELLAQMRDAYNSAELFFTPEPSMDMAGLDNLRRCGVVAAAARNRRETLVANGVVSGAQRLVVVAMGGIAHRVPVESWPRLNGVVYAVPQVWGIKREDCIAIEQCGLPFSELLASADLLVTKPGYGTFTEAVVNGIPLLFVRRGNWPEEPCLVAWLEKHGSSMELSREQLEGEGPGAAIEMMLQRESPEPIRANGVDEVAQYLHDRLIALST